jgi:phage terminase small subunit
VNPKHQQFINEYLKCWNATEAYRRVYPTSSDDAARAHAARLVANGSVAEAIQQRIAENAMSADEVLSRLAEHARGDIGDFVTINHEGLPTVDLSTAQNKMRLIKTNKKTYTTKGDKDTAITEVDAEIELYDAQSALEKLGRHHKLFTDKTELTGKDGEDLIPLALLQPGQLDKLK